MRTDASAPVLIETPCGPVRGIVDVDAVARFGGVPYAHVDRFAEPEACTWRGVFDATRPGAAPPQLAGGLDLVPDTVPERQGEQCLTAEIRAPSGSWGVGGLPVIVWVPGGSYRIGGASLATYDGTALAREGVVVIGLNYRLGALGWLAADGVPTNLGLRDLRAAIAWVREVAPSFGGDPRRVVLMGESAGAGAIAHLLAAEPELPVAGAILQSGAPAATLSERSATWVAEQVLDAAAVPDVDALRRLPVDALLAAQEHAVQAALAPVGMMPFHPWIDGALLHGAPCTAELASVPLVVGTNAAEMELFRDQVPDLPEAVAVDFLGRKAAALGIPDVSVREALRAAGGDLVEAIADLELHVPNELLARAHTARGNRVWRYRFTWESPERGACHALDLPFTFGTLDVSTWRDFAGAHTPAADALSARMRRAWASFAANGAPGDETLGPWPRDERVYLGPPPESHDPVSARVDLWLRGR